MSAAMITAITIGTIFALSGWLLYISQVFCLLAGDKKPPSVRRYIYWKVNQKGLPEPDFTDHETMHLYGHVHLVEIPIPEDVQVCMEEFKNPPVCLVLDKFGKPRGGCHEGSVS